MTNPFNKDGSEESTAVNTEADVTVDDLKKNEDSPIDFAQPDAEIPNSDIQLKYDELNNQYIRLAADFENYRKRQAQERESLLKYGAENTLKKIIDVLDNFERGAKANETTDDCEKLRESFNLVHKQLIEVLEKAGLKTIEAEGKEFDPNFHEAVMQTPTSEYPEHTIIAVLQKGYQLGDRVLRPALVNVATEEN